MTEHKAKQERLDFSTRCVAEVFPEANADRQPKRIIFHQAAMWGIEQDDCPQSLRAFKKLRRYIRNHWPTIRLMLPQQENILPCYINGATFGGGGGYRKGNVKLARKQLEMDHKVADGVVSAADEFAKATGEMFPQIPVVMPSKRIGK